VRGYALTWRWWYCNVCSRDTAVISSLFTLRALNRAYLGEFGRAMDEVSAVQKTGSKVGVVHYNEACIFALAAASMANDAARDPAERTALAKKYAANAMNSLAESRRTGFFEVPFDVALFRSDPDLDWLRSRTDFQLFAMDVTFPAEPFARAR
jgi:hypothetical protein